MSDSGEDRAEVTERQALSRLEIAVGRLLEDRATAVSRAKEAEERIQELEALLGKFTKGKLDAVSLEEAVGNLQDQNAELRRRIIKGGEGVERLLSRVKFLENQR